MTLYSEIRGALFHTAPPGPPPGEASGNAGAQPLLSNCHHPTHATTQCHRNVFPELRCVSTATPPGCIFYRRRSIADKKMGPLMSGARQKNARVPVRRQSLSPRPVPAATDRAKKVQPVCGSRPEIRLVEKNYEAFVRFTCAARR